MTWSIWSAPLRSRYCLPDAVWQFGRQQWQLRHCIVSMLHDLATPALVPRVRHHLSRWHTVGTACRCRNGTLPVIRSTFPYTRLAVVKDNENCHITLAKLAFGKPVRP
jgi:membrane protein YdbS with pleckstrin-like domain